MEITIELWLILLAVGNTMAVFSAAIILGKWSDMAIRKWFKVFLGTAAASLAFFSIVNIIILTLLRNETGLLWSGGLQLLSSMLIVLVLAVTGRKQGNRRKEETGYSLPRALQPSSWTTVTPHWAPEKRLNYEKHQPSEILTGVIDELEAITQSFDRRVM